jgi:predicted DNA-binding transcriptional regulator YafY
LSSKLKLSRQFVQLTKIDPPLDNGWIPANLCYETEKEAKEYILGFGDRIRIIQPSTLLDSIYDTAKAVVDFYNRDNE